MNAQKRIKTIGYEIRDFSDKKQKNQKFDKSTPGLRNHKQSEIHIKSVSKDITPKKHSATIQKTKYKQNGGLSNVKMIKSKQLTSVCSYSAIDKQSIPVTKRKGSNPNPRSIKKKKSKNNTQIHQSLRSTVSNFSILTKCLTQYIKQEKKKGKDPSGQILQLIKAFNRSQVAPLSKQLQILIGNMLDYIEGAVGIPHKEQSPNIINEGPRMKSRSSFSSASEREVVYSQILQNSYVPSTIKKHQDQRKQRSTTLENNFMRSKEQHIDENKEQVQSDLESQVQNNKRLSKNKEQKFNRQLEKQLKEDLKNMHNQLSYLKTAGQKLQSKTQFKLEDRAKLQQIYNKNKKVLQSLNSKTSNLKQAQKYYKREETEDYDAY